MNVRELIEELSKFNPETPVFVMNDNGCGDPGYDEVTSTLFRYSDWYKKEVVFIDSDC